MHHRNIKLDITYTMFYLFTNNAYSIKHKLIKFVCDIAQTYHKNYKIVIKRCYLLAQKKRYLFLIFCLLYVWAFYFLVLTSAPTLFVLHIFLFLMHQKQTTKKDRNKCLVCAVFTYHIKLYACAVFYCYFCSLFDPFVLNGNDRLYFRFV